MDKKFKLVYLEWNDAFEAPDTWMTIKRVEEWGKNEDWIVEEIGWILEENKKYILIANRRTKDGMYSSVMKIPKTWILKRIDLTKHI